jgi:hypothetical protein
MALEVLLVGKALDSSSYVERTGSKGSFVAKFGGNALTTLDGPLVEGAGFQGVRASVEGALCIVSESFAGMNLLVNIVVVLSWMSICKTEESGESH